MHDPAVPGYPTNMCFTKQPGGLEYSRVKRFLGLVRYATPISSITGVVILRVITGKSRRYEM